jgi:hypothetical protein
MQTYIYDFIYIHIYVIIYIYIVYIYIYITGYHMCVRLNHAHTSHNITAQPHWEYATWVSPSKYHHRWYEADIHIYICIRVIQKSTASSHQLASVSLNLQSSNAYGGVVSDPIEEAQYNERLPLVLRNAAGAQIVQC